MSEHDLVLARDSGLPAGARVVHARAYQPVKRQSPSRQTPAGLELAGQAAQRALGGVDTRLPLSARLVGENCRESLGRLEKARILQSGFQGGLQLVADISWHI